MKENAKVLVSDYSKCEIELKNKTEEVGKIKKEIQELKQIIELECQTKNKADDTNTDITTEESTDKEQFTTGSVRKKKALSHPTARQPGPEYNCMDCIFKLQEEKNLETILI